MLLLSANNDHTAVFSVNVSLWGWLFICTYRTTKPNFQSGIHLQRCHHHAPPPPRPLCLFTCRSVSSALKGHGFAPLTPWPPAAYVLDQQILNQSVKVFLLPTDYLTVAREQCCRRWTTAGQSTSMCVCNFRYELHQKKRKQQQQNWFSRDCPFYCTTV